VERQRVERQRVDEVRLSVPARAPYLRIVRLVAADSASRAGFDWETVEDFRLAVDELAHTVMSVTEGDLVIVFRSADGHVKVSGRARSRTPSVQLVVEELSERILVSLADHHNVCTEDGEITFLVSKDVHDAVSA
jgi:hypothetical protein